LTDEDIDLEQAHLGRLHGVEEGAGVVQVDAGLEALALEGFAGAGFCRIYRFTGGDRSW